MCIQIDDSFKFLYDVQHFISGLLGIQHDMLNISLNVISYKMIRKCLGRNIVDSCILCQLSMR